MGNNQSEIDINTDYIKKESSDEKGALDAEAIEEFTSKAKKCTCKILLESGYGSGFFCRIPLSKTEIIDALITCNHVLTETIILSSQNIKIEINKENKELSKKGRRIFTNPKLDYTCIEILDDDGIDDFYSIDDKNLNKNFSGEYYIDKLVIIYAIMKNRRLGLSNGLIKKMNDKLFLYTCNTFPGCSGGVILNQITNCVVGIHIGEHKKEKKKPNMNIGFFIRGIIDDINNNKKSNLSNLHEDIKKSNLENQHEDNKKSNLENELEKENNNNKTYFDDVKEKKYIKKEVDEISGLIIALVGECSGKTSYFNEIRDLRKENPPTTTGPSIFKKKLKINESLINFSLLDTSDWERSSWPGFKTILRELKPNGIMICFNLSRRESFLNLNDYKEKLKGTEINLSEIPILLIGTPINGEIEVKSEEAIKFAKENDFIGYFEISLKGKNIKESFEYMANFLYKIYYN